MDLFKPCGRDHHRDSVMKGAYISLITKIRTKFLVGTVVTG